MMKRREFISLLGGAAAAWPLAARAQQGVRRIGIMMNLAADDPEGQARIAAFLQGMQETGWVVGRNAQIDIRWGMGDPERIRKNVTELLALTPDAIFATTFPSWRYNRRHAPCRSYSRDCLIRSARVWLQAWHGRAATPPDLPRLNTA
jgi:hypothetical protein